MENFINILLPTNQPAKNKGFDTRKRLLQFSISNIEPAEHLSELQ
jgi:hypothetical protein